MHAEGGCRCARRAGAHRRYRGAGHRACRRFARAAGARSPTGFAARLPLPEYTAERHAAWLTGRRCHDASIRRCRYSRAFRRVLARTPRALVLVLFRPAARLRWPWRLVHPLPRLDLQPVRQCGRSAGIASIRWATIARCHVLVRGSTGPRCRQTLPRWPRSVATCRRARAAAQARGRRCTAEVCITGRVVRIDGVPSGRLPADLPGCCHPGSNAAASNPLNCSS